MSAPCPEPRPLPRPKSDIPMNSFDCMPGPPLREINNRIPYTRSAADGVKNQSWPTYRAVGEVTMRFSVFFYGKVYH